MAALALLSQAVVSTPWSSRPTIAQQPTTGGHHGLFCWVYGRLYVYKTFEKILGYASLYIHKCMLDCTFNVLYVLYTLTGICLFQICTTGFGLGAYHYALKMFVYQRVRARNFARAWSFVQASQALPLVCGIPLAGICNLVISYRL